MDTDDFFEELASKLNKHCIAYYTNCRGPPTMWTKDYFEYEEYDTFHVIDTICHYSREARQLHNGGVKVCPDCYETIKEQRKKFEKRILLSKILKKLEDNEEAIDFLNDELKGLKTTLLDISIQLKDINKS